MPEDNESNIPPTPLPIIPQYAANEKVEKINVSDEINGILRARGFDLPIDSSNDYALSFLNTACIFGTMARWARTKFPSDTGPGGTKGLAAEYEGKYQAFLKLIELRTLGVPDVSRDDAISGFEHSSRPFARRRSVW